MFETKYWQYMSTTEICIDILMDCLGIFAYALGALTIGAVAYIIIALALDLHPQPEPQVALLQKSKAEQFASSLANELAKKDVNVKIIITRD